MMGQDYMRNWTSLMNQMQRPLQEIMELNAKTLQNLNYMKPEDLSKIRKPEDLMEKNLAIFVENGHKALDYWQKTFSIIENSLVSFSKEVKDKTEEVRKAQGTPFSQSQTTTSKK